MVKRKTEDHEYTGEQLSQVTSDGFTYKVGDDILLNGGDKNMPFVGKVKSIARSRFHGAKEKDADVGLQCAWYYRPEDIPGGRQWYHGQRELLLSGFLEWNSINTVLRPCKVHTLEAYVKLKRIGPSDFYSRFKYNSITTTVSPDDVAVYCTCQQPFNPDRLMLRCSQCQNWYHLECVGVRRRELDKMDGYTCRSCISMYAEK